MHEEGNPTIVDNVGDINNNDEIAKADQTPAVSKEE